MNVINEIDKLPQHIQQEVFDYVEFLINKYQSDPKLSDPWIKNIRRGKSIGESASETVVKMRNEAKW